MALLGALAAAGGGGGRRGCVLRVAADAITFYCGGGSAVGSGAVGIGRGGSAGRGLSTGSADLAAAVDDDGDGGPGSGGGVRGGGSGAGSAADYYLRAAGGVVAGHGRAVTAAVDGGDPGGAGPGPGGRIGDYFRPARSVSGAGGGYFYDVNGTAASVLFNGTAGVETYLNGSYNQTVIADNVEDLTNYIFVITIGIILGAMILTTICGKSSLDVVSALRVWFSNTGSIKT